jgi:hypothetical protein
MSNMVYYSLYVCQNYDREFYDHSQDRFRAIPRYIIDKLAYYCLRFGPMATDGSHNSASIRKLERDKFCIFLLNYLNKTPHQLLRSKHKAADGTGWLSLVHRSAEPYQLLYKPF